MRRKMGTLIPIEESIVDVAKQLHQTGIKEFYGFQIAQKMEDAYGTRLIVEYGTLYRALARLQKMGLLESRWEDTLPTDQNRPRRRYYRLVG